MDSVPGAGTFVTSSIQYVRITNNSTVTPIKLIVSSSSRSYEFFNCYW
jgi:hypothetical protein